jgi:hypothetical protein
MWLIYDRIWPVSASRIMRQKLDETIRSLASLPQRLGAQEMELASATSDSISRSFTALRSATDAVLLEFGADRIEDLAIRNRVRAWQPLLLTIFQLRLALLRRGRAGDPEAYGRTAIEAVEFSTKVLNGIRSLIIPSPMVIQPTSEIATEAPFIQGDEPTLRIASSLVAVSVYLLEDALTEGS